MEEGYLEFLRNSIKQNEEEAKKVLAEQKQRQIEKLLNDSGLGRRFQKRTFETFIADTPITDLAKGIALRFTEKFPEMQGLLFIGPVGTGKTHLAAAIANDLIQKFYTVIFRNAVDIISTIVSTYQKDASTYEVINAFTSADLLVIDDLGKERMTEFTSSVLYQIINKLYEDEKPIIITTNFNSEQLAKRLGERGDAIVSRITEMCRPIMLDGPDWRLRNARGS